MFNCHPFQTRLELGPGWWILSVLLIALVFFCFGFLGKNGRKTNIDERLLVELEAIHSRH